MNSLPQRTFRFPGTIILILILIPFLFSSALLGEPAYDVNDPPEGLFSEQWMEIRLNGYKVGYVWNSLAREGQEVHSRTYTRMQFNRGPVSLSITSEETTAETLAGVPESFHYTTKMGELPLVMDGAIRDGGLTVKTTQAGVEREARYDWIPGALMSWGFTRRTLLEGFAEGTAYTLFLFSPDLQVNKPVESRIEIGGKETFSHRDREMTGVKITTTMNFKMGRMETRSWVDAMGNPLKSVMDMGGMAVEMYAADQSVALSDFVPADIFDFTLLSLDRPIPPDARSVTFLIKFKNPPEETMAWPETASQHLLAKNSKEARLIVRRGDLAALEQDDPPPPGMEMGEYLKDNSMLNTHDPALVQLAGEAAGEELRGVPLADRLRRFTSRYISDKSLEVGFATASEVVRKAEGDCTEHAVLLTALGRIRGIPSRVATGLAYLPEYMGKENVLGFHMWTQFYLKGRWVDFDAALGESESSPTRIAFYAGSLDEKSLIDVSLSLMDVLGRIEVEVEAIEN